MNRRAFLAATGGVGLLAEPYRSLAAERTAHSAARRSRPRITHVEIWRLEGAFETDGQARQWQVQPLHVYDAFRPAPYRKRPDPKPSTSRYAANYLTIRTDDGGEGWYGPVDTEAAVVVDRQLKAFLLGKDPLAGEALWDQMYRLNRHARSGHFMMAISAVDNALWDWRGRHFGVPVYVLLGGPTRSEVEVYGSTLGRSILPEDLHETSRRLSTDGFRHQKWFLSRGPGDGPEGLTANVEMVRILREAVGPDVDLMFDAFMGWDLNYAVSWARRVEAYGPRWIEEAFSPDKLDSFAALSRETSIPVATGEHFYGRWEVLHFLRADAISVVQADPEWCGGVSELTKICILASAFDAQVVPHGHNLHAALHVIASQSPLTCPLAEYLIDKMSSYYLFETADLEPVAGKITLTDRPGFGIAFDEAQIQDKRLVTFS